MGGGVVNWVRGRGIHADLADISFVQVSGGTGEILPIKVLENIPHGLLKTA